MYVIYLYLKTKTLIINRNLIGIKMEVLHSDDVEAIQQYLSTPECRLKINEIGKYNRTPLFAACSTYRNDIVDLLILNGANVNLVSGFYEETPLHNACIVGDLYAVNKLLAEGADPNIGNFHNTIPIMFAVQGKYLDIAKVLTPYTNFNHEDKNRCTIFSYAISQEQNTDQLLYEQTINYIFDFCNDINHTNWYGNTYLHDVVSHKNKYLIEFLLNKGIDINICNRDGKRAFEQTDDAEILALFKRD